MPVQQVQEQAQRSFTGRFQSRRGDDALRVTSADGNRTLFFNRPAPLELPERLDGVMVRELPRMQSEQQRRFELESGGRSWTVRARSLQIHERAELYGTVIALPRYELRRRILWSLLLRLARYRFGQVLIRRVTGSK